jgi:Carboxypeptidase regulatory-like domain
MRSETTSRKRMGRDTKLGTIFVLLFVVSALAVYGPCAWAQSIVTGGLSGVITDHTGAVVNDARLTLRSSDTGDQYKAVSSANGEYTFSLLKPGVYVLTIDKEGFKALRSTVTIQLGTTVTANLSLDVGGTSETIEVTGAAPLLQTEDANISTNFETQQIREIPNPGGDITYIAQTAPGVVMNSNGFGYGNFSTFGLPGTSNLFTVNGNDYNDPFFNLNNSGSSNLTLGGNELQQVSVVSNAYTGQYGRQAGSQIDYATRSGSNAWHGNAVYNWTGRYLNANDPVLIAGFTTQGKAAPPRPFENNNQWAASIGGPILKNKAYFFFNTEGIRYIFATVNQTFVPTQAFETATLANIPQDAATQAFYNNMFSLYNNAPGIANAQAGGGCGLLAGNAPCTESWKTAASSGNHEYLITGRFDLSISDKDKIFGRTKFDRGVQPTYTDLINPAFDTFSTQPQDEGQLNYTHVFSPNVVNNFIGSVLYYSALFGNIAPGAKALSLFPGNLAMTDGSITNLGFGSGLGGYQQAFFFPQGRNVTQYGLVDDLSIARGNHSLKMGFNFKRADVGDHAPASTAFYPAINTTLAGLFNDQVANFTNYNFAQHDAVSEAFYSVGMYFQDEFRATSNLKFTLALRADRNSPGVCQSACAGHTPNGFQNMPHGADVPYNQSFLTGGKTIIPELEMISFQPRFGLAWSPAGKNTVIRTGVGLFTDLYPAALVGFVDTNFPQVNLWAVGSTPPASLAWDLNPPATTAFPNSGVTLVENCNAAFTSNYNNGGNLNTYLAAAPNCGGSVPAFFDVNRPLRNPKYVEWNLEIQHSIGTRAVVSANYVGNRGYDELYRNPFLNAFGFGSELPATAPDPRVGQVAQLRSGAVSNYNGLTLSYQQNSWHGLSGRINYTYSHAFDEISNGGALPFSVNNSVILQNDPDNLRSSYASSDYDSRHSITASYVYELPFKSTNRLLNAAIGGWQLSGTMFWHTSFPFTVVDGATVAGLAGNNVFTPNLGGPSIILQPEFSQRTFSNGRACINPSAPCFGIDAPNGINNTAPFLFSSATNFTGSVVGRNAFRGPNFLGGDLSLRKNFKVTERVDLQLGLNAYNWLNHANYFNPTSNTLFGQGFGVVSGTQFTPTSPYGAFALAATDMRIAAVEGKITF